MSLRLLVNLLLLLTVTALGIFIAYSPDDKDKNIVRLGGPPADTITTITIQSNGLSDIYLEIKDNVWQMTNPYKVRANDAPIKALLELSKAISHSRFSTENKNLPAYELLPAKASLAMNGVEYLFGNIEHINKRRYILRDKTVHLTTDLFYHRLRTNTESFISPKLIPENSQIIGLKSSQLELNKSAQGEWLVSGKQSTSPISSDAIQILLDHWQHKQAIQILPLNITGNETPLQILFSDKSMINFLVKRSEKTFTLIRKDLGLQYRLPIGAANDLLTLKQP